LAACVRGDDASAGAGTWMKQVASDMSAVKKSGLYMVQSLRTSFSPRLSRFGAEVRATQRALRGC